jgi:hypothetical protein
MNVWLHYSADPAKTPEWAEKIRIGMLDDNAYAREYELDFSSLEGTKVFGTSFLDSHIISDDNGIDEKYPVYIGIDWGFHSPALLVTQFSPNTDQWLWLREFVGINMQVTTFLDVCAYLLGLINFPLMSMDTLSEEAATYIREKKLEPFTDKKLLIKAFCDIAGSQVSDKGERTNISIAQSAPYRFRLVYKKVFIEPRITLMAMRLRTRSDGNPGLLVSSRCSIIIDGFHGGFVRDKRGEIADTIHTHLFDCAGYIISNISNIHKEQSFLKSTDDREDWSKYVLNTDKYIPKPLAKRHEKRLAHAV